MSLSSRPILRIATRASQLALWQSNYIADLIRQAAPETAVTLVHVTTTGDRDQTETLRSLGSFGVFSREVQLAVLDGRADMAVHSLKDLPTDGPPQLTLAATPVRAITHDALILPSGQTAAPPHEHQSNANGHHPLADSVTLTKSSDLPGRTGTSLPDLRHGSRVGTGSPRRQAQLRYLRPDLQLLEVRGNVDTRLRKLDQGEYDALILAAAGLTRLGLSDRIHCPIAPPEMYPAVGQGAVGVECRTDDVELRTLLRLISDTPTFSAVTAERSLLSTLRAGCHAPLGVKTQVNQTTIEMEAVVLPLDGQHRWMANASTNIVAAEELGKQVAELLTAQGVDRVLHAVNR